MFSKHILIAFGQDVIRSDFIVDLLMVNVWVIIGISLFE